MPVCHVQSTPVGLLAPDHNGVAAWPRPHARLASGRWSGATGRAFHPQGSDERFQICYLEAQPHVHVTWSNSHGDHSWMVNLSAEEPDALMRARPGLWEPWRATARATRPGSTSGCVQCPRGHHLAIAVQLAERKLRDYRRPLSGLWLNCRVNRSEYWSVPAIIFTDNSSACSTPSRPARMPNENSRGALKSGVMVKDCLPLCKSVY